MKSKQLLFIFIAGVCIVITGYAGLFWLLYSVNDGTETLIRDTAEQQKKIDEQRSLQTLAKDIKPSADRLESFVVTKDGDIHFIEFLEKLGKDQGVTLSIASVNEKQGDKFNDFVFQISVQGSWSKVVRFVELLETIPYKIKMTSVGLDLLGDGPSTSGPTSWRAAIEFSVSKEK